MSGVVKPARHSRQIFLPLLMLAPLAVYVTLRHTATEGLAAVVLMLQAAGMAWLGLGIAWPDNIERFRWVSRIIVSVAAPALVAWLWWHQTQGLVMAAALPHAVAYLSLLTLFARSLVTPRIAVITMVATRIRGPLPPELVRYTRNVTRAWCGFFAMQLLVSLTLGVLAMLDVTSFEPWRQFVTVWNFPLISIMFLGEYALRRWLHAGHNPTRLIDTLRGFRRTGSQ